MPLSFIQYTMGSAVTLLLFALHAKSCLPPSPRKKFSITHSLNVASIIDSDIKREYIRSIESLNMKGNERTVSWDFVTLFPLFKK